MLTIQQLAKKIHDVADSRLDCEAFEEWFVSASWGDYSVHRGVLSDAIAAVHHALRAYELNEIDEIRFASSLEDAIRPFVVPGRLRTQYSHNLGCLSLNPDEFEFATPENISRVMKQPDRATGITYGANQLLRVQMTPYRHVA